MALARLGHADWRWQELVDVARANERDGWRFTEWFHGRTMAPQGMAGQSWNAAAFLWRCARCRRGSRHFLALGLGVFHFVLGGHCQNAERVMRLLFAALSICCTRRSGKLILSRTPWS